MCVHVSCLSASAVCVCMSHICLRVLSVSACLMSSASAVCVSACLMSVCECCLCSCMSHVICECCLCVCMSHVCVSACLVFLCDGCFLCDWNCSCGNDQKQYLLDIGIFAVLQSILDGFTQTASVIMEAFCVIACLSDICKFSLVSLVVTVSLHLYIPLNS